MAETMRDPLVLQEARFTDNDEPNGIARCKQYLNPLNCRNAHILAVTARDPVCNLFYKTRDILPSVGKPYPHLLHYLIRQIRIAVPSIPPIMVDALEDSNGRFLRSR
jgi:hypothetical protein